MRCLALAQAWYDHMSDASAVTFICACLPEALEKRLTGEGFRVLRIAGEPGNRDDIQRTTEILQQVDIAHSWMVLDGYRFDLSYQLAMRETRIKLLVIDDYHHLGRYQCDILVNQNIGSESIVYRINDDARQLCGLDFTLLRRDFLLASVGRKHIRPAPVALACDKEPLNVLVTMGGGDLHGMTEYVVRALTHCDGTPLRINIVVGAASSSYDRIRQCASTSPHHTDVLSNVKDMRTLMQWADLAVSAAGSTCWELLLNGVPLMVLVLAENQEGVAREMQTRGVAENLGWYYDWSDEMFLSKFNRLLHDIDRREQMSVRGQALVDGQGCKRVLAAMKAFA